MQHLVPIPPPTLGAFRFWLMRSRPGEEFVYHFGLLHVDRAHPVLTGTHRDQDPIGRHKAAAAQAGHDDPEFELSPVEAVDALGRAAWAAHEAGDVVLKQRRLAPGYFAYVAQRRREAEHAWKEAG